MTRRGSLSTTFRLLALDLLMNSWGDEGIFTRIEVLDTHAAEFASMFDQINQAVLTDPEVTLGQFRELFRAQIVSTDPD
jgi:hypothetical protein